MGIAVYRAGPVGVRHLGALLRRVLAMDVRHPGRARRVVHARAVTAPGEIIDGDRLRSYGIKWYAERGWKA